MPSNNRIFYPLEEICIGPEGSSSGNAVHGVQSVSMTTSFNVEPIFELGQLELYELIENLPNVEISVEKVIDGYPLIYHLGTRGATSSTLLNRTNRKADVVFSLFSESQDNASGAPLTQVLCSGMYINSLNYSLNTQGAAKESVTFVGNDKLWKTSSFLFNGHFTGNDAPSYGTVLRRQHVVMGAATTGSIWPSVIPGVTSTNGSGYNLLTAGQFGAHIQDVSISVNLNREDILELGRKRPYYRYASFPTAVNCTINTISCGTTPGDLINASGEAANNLSNEPIMVKLSDGTVFDLGNKNKLTSVTTSGGDTSGGNQTLSYSFENYNILKVINTATDPEALP